MPPDISAGLMALAAAPPGAAFSAGPPLPEPLSASLFAAFLAQSSPPSVTPAAPEAAATQRLPADPKQTPLEKPALPKSKTMDTLPMLSFLLTPKTTAKASELPVSQAAKHQKSPEDQAAAGGMPTPNMPACVPVLISQAAAPLPLAPTPPVQAMPSQAAPGQTVSSKSAPAQSAPAQSALPTLAAMPATDTEQAPAAAQAPSAPAAAMPASALSTAQPVSPNVPLPSPKADGITAAKPAAEMTAQAAAASGLPRIPSPVSFASSQAVPQAQGVPQETMPPLSPFPAQAASQNTFSQDTFSQDTWTASPAVTVAGAALPAPETPKLNPAKTAGKSLPAALKPAGENADTYTRATPGREPIISVKAGVPAAAPEPILEKHAEEQKPSSTAGSGTNNALTLSQAAAPADTAKAEAKPLSAGDRAEIVRQAAEAVTKMPLPAKNGASEQMSVQLHPKDWGSLQVSVSVAPSQNAGAAKTVTAHIVAETPQVKAALQSQTGALHQALRASGLHLEHLTVSVKAPEGRTVEVKTAAQSASAGSSSGQGQADQSRADRSGQSYGQPGAAPGGFGMGGSQSHRQGQPPPAFASAPEPEAEDDLLPATPLRPASGRIDTRA